MSECIVCKEFFVSQLEQYLQLFLDEAQEQLETLNRLVLHLELLPPMLMQ